MVLRGAAGVEQKNSKRFIPENGGEIDFKKAKLAKMKYFAKFRQN